MDVVLPPLKLDTAVHEYVKNTFCQHHDPNVDKDGEDEDGEDLLRRLLGVLGTPPMYTTLRVNTLRGTTGDIRELIQAQLHKQYSEKNQTASTVTDHPVLDDTLVIPNTGPMNVQQVAKRVIVGLGCGVAVLRGANVFAQGIVGAPSNMSQGDTVSVHADIEGSCKKGLIKPFDGAAVFVGNGVVEISRHDLFCTSEKIRGIAIRMTEPLYVAPSLSELSPEMIFPQNLPSIVCAHVLDPQPGETILDMCAAPGGKTTHIAALMNNEGRVVALDKSANKRDKLLSNVKLWAASCVDVYITDSSKCIASDADVGGPPPYPPGSFDRVLVDAPCSALGQRPSCRNTMTLTEVKSYSALQRKIFTKAVEAVKEGGVIVYSTCTVPVEENEHQVAWALQQFPCLRLEQQTPHIGGEGRRGNRLTYEQCTLVQRFDPSSVPVVTPTVDTDTIGFFIAKFVKRNDSNVVMMPASCDGGETDLEIR